MFIILHTFIIRMYTILCILCILFSFCRNWKYEIHYGSTKFIMDCFFLELTGTDAFHLTRCQQKSSNEKWFLSNGLFVSMSCSQKLKEQLALG